MKIFGIAGYSGSGKTTLIEKLLPCFTAAGLRVSVVKHAHHGFDVDRPGKDSYRHRAAGASEVLITSGARWALLHENSNPADGEEPSLEEYVSHLSPCDLVLVEGFKNDPIPKLEIHRPENGKPLLFPDNSRVIAVAMPQGAQPEMSREASVRFEQVERLDIDDVDAIARFVMRYLDLPGKMAG